MDHRKRRVELMRQMGEGAVAIFPAAPERVRNSTSFHPFRQDSDFHYLTGFGEPDSVLLLVGGKSVLFVPPRDPEKEIWDGKRAGVDGAIRDFGADEAHSIEELERLAPTYLQNAKELVYRLGFDPAWDERVIRWLKALRVKARTGITPPAAVRDPGPLVHEMRLRKDDAEIATMKRAGAITREAFLAAMAQARPGVREYEIQATMEGIFRGRGGAGPAYGTIVAAGVNGTILHYRAGDEMLNDGDLCLIDAGAELDCYASDVTRTFPANGRFTGAQKACYEITLAAWQAAVDLVKPGSSLEKAHDAAVRVLTEGMISLGLLKGSVDEAIETQAFRRYYMHRTSHWLGLDVHDVGAYHVDGQIRPFEAGMVLTVEPGLYIGAHDEQAPEELRGIGIRIEDDVLVTSSGHEILTPGIPRTVAEVEEACRR